MLQMLAVWIALAVDVIYITKEKEDIATERYETMSESLYMTKANLVIGHKLICSAKKASSPFQ